MCRLCGSENERNSERKLMEMRVADLKRLAGHIELMAYGRIKPHTDEAKKIVSLAHSLIRYLVEEYI